MRSIARTTVATVLAGVLASALTGCGSDEDDAAAPTPASAATDPQTGADQPDASVDPGDAGDSGPAATADLESVRMDVETVAVALESLYRGDPYPQTTAEVVETLDGTALELAAGNNIGGYVYDPDTIEFTLCIESRSGAWATYDTAPMTLRENGATGGCPFD